MKCRPQRFKNHSVKEAFICNEDCFYWKECNKDIKRVIERCDTVSKDVGMVKFDRLLLKNLVGEKRRRMYRRLWMRARRKMPKTNL